LGKFIIGIIILANIPLIKQLLSRRKKTPWPHQKPLD
jgi:hypothetical protein